MKKHLLVVGIIFLFIFSTVSPLVFGVNIQISNEIEPQSTSPSGGGLMNSSWPMYCHDTRHTSQSQYNSINNLGIEKWRYKISGWRGKKSPVIDNNGNIYIGGSGKIYSFLYNGTLNWSEDIWGSCSASIAIDENGIIYVPTANSYPSYFYAFDLNGSELWKYQHEWENYYSSPVIDKNGIIYFGDYSGWFYAMNPNGTEKWRYKTDGYIPSSPAVDEDGIIYCVSAYQAEAYLYAFYPNGSLKWKKDDINRYIDVSIGNDGTIFYLSFQNLYAINSDGSLKWKTPVDYGTTPSISDDGVIYIGYKSVPGEFGKTFKAFSSENGDFLWSFNPGNYKYKYISNPAISADGILYIVTTIGDQFSSDGGEIISLNPDGTERWREWLTDNSVESIPAIDSDGTVYVVSSHYDFCYLHAFGELDSNAPTAPSITCNNRIIPFIEYEFSFKSTSPLSNNLFYWIEWGDSKNSGWIGPYNSDELVKVTHKWEMIKDKFKIRARAKDTDNLWGPWAELEVSMPREKAIHNSLIYRILEQFPIIKEVLLRLINPLR